ncbi:MAG: thiamine pyrophosphate-binding protein [Rhodospirillaceae bacterium]|jgi:acetolactate synthase I/II/III large subunit|nr:thiamine pyrophosphate-binding protein [Rhodospirillaceae bacterium]MBT4486446.1 thiamine pyrophosphate-binding protein [Rhodospirillaceae bacterium]MBT5194731.1 thiamine pyrophosphate-binding protein [Rhodospirillaceae bacterium]MBT5897390.1 thiamine pyrophosphate-binding protein [Rhodospirillaceae bacterium]MBT6429593.1 thiamine pyrophosphate-binding protein [Rhodospirillaceae bacterium]
MPNSSNMRTGGRILVDQLKIHNVDTAFCVPGESYLAALDALHDTPEIRLLTCRHEANAANMAEAYGKLTGRPGICFVTRGPGACHAVVGLHTAFQDSSPLVLFVGQVGREMMEREAFQEMDFRRFFGQVSKWSAEIQDPGRIPELVSQAFHVATSGRPGPVVLSLPEDMLRELSGVGDAKAYRGVQAHPGPDDMAQLREMLAAAKRPVMMLGGGTWTPKAVADITAFAEANNLPVSCAFRNQDRFDNYHENYVGEVGIGSNPALIARLKETDLLLAVGPRLGEQTTQGYSLLDIPVPQLPMVHIHPDAGELGRVYQADLPINAGMEAFAAAARAMAPVDSAAWADSVGAARREYLDYVEIQPTLGDLDLADVLRVLRERLPKDALVANDAGNFSGWAHRYLPFSTYPSQVGPTNGAMGYGVPAALAAAVVFPQRTTVCFVGDGGFLMASNELATALQYDLKPIYLVINNGMFGTIRMHQERDYPGREVATELRNPDFAAYAQSFGAFGEIVERSEDFAGALDRALAADTVAVLELRTDPEAINTRTTLTAIREASLAKQGG